MKTLDRILSHPVFCLLLLLALWALGSCGHGDNAPGIINTSDVVNRTVYWPRDHVNNVDSTVPMRKDAQSNSESVDVESGLPSRHIKHPAS